MFGDILSDELGRWNNEEQRPLTSDTLHLGKSGIRMLARNIKSYIVGRGRIQSRSRFSASGGQYQAAAGRGGHHQDGYQPPSR